VFILYIYIYCSFIIELFGCRTKGMDTHYIVEWRH